MKKEGVGGFCNACGLGKAAPGLTRIERIRGNMLVKPKKKGGYRIRW